MTSVSNNLSTAPQTTSNALHQTATSRTNSDTQRATKAVKKATPPKLVPSSLKPVTETQLKNSVASVIGSLEAKTVKPEQLDTMKLSEEIIYAANVRAHLGNESNAVLATFDKELKERYDSRTQRNDSQAIAKSINDILDNAVQGKQISAETYNAIVADSLGKSQIDKAKTAVSNKVVVGGIAKAVSMLTTNAAANVTQLASFEKSVSKLQFQSPATTRAHTAKLTEIFKSIDANSIPAATTTNTTAKPTSTTTSTANTTTPTKGIDESSVLTEIPDPTLNSSPTSLDYRNKSQNDPNMLLRLPINYGQNIVSVTLQDASGRVLEEQAIREKGTDGRLYFRFSHQGESYGASFNAVLTYTNDSTRAIRIENSKLNTSKDLDSN